MSDRRTILVLGGTGWLGREIARQAVARGDDVTCLARGLSGAAAPEATFIQADRVRHDAYRALEGQQWDEVIELSWQPRFVREAVASVGGSARHWTYVSSCSVYARQDVANGAESEDLHDPIQTDEATPSEYGQAKSACEQMLVGAVGDRLLRVRPGLIGGPGDPTGRSTYWVTRAASAPRQPILAPSPPDAPTQIIDVRDLATWVLDAGRDGLVGAFNAVGPLMSLADWIGLARLVGDHRSGTVWADGELLLAHGVEQFAGERSLPLWIAEPSLRGFFMRDGSAAQQHGLRHRPRLQMLADSLAWVEEHGQASSDALGLSLEDEQALVREVLDGTP